MVLGAKTACNTKSAKPVEVKKEAQLASGLFSLISQPIFDMKVPISYFVPRFYKFYSFFFNKKNKNLIIQHETGLLE